MTTDAGDWSLECIYDSARFTVVLISYDGAVRGYEICDKQAAAEVYLTDGAAVAFTDQRMRWKMKEPEQDEVESTLDGYTFLGLMPLNSH